MIVAVALQVAASAADCSQPYALDHLLDDVGVVESALRSGNGAQTAEAAVRLRAGLPCMDAPLPQVVAARSIRAMAAGLLVTDYADEALNWLVTAATLDLGYRFDLESLREDDAMFGTWDAVVASASGLDAAVLEGRAFTSGSHWLNGRRITTPTAIPGVPHLYQHEQDGELHGAFIRGTDFPEDVLTAAPLTLDPAPVAVAPPLGAYSQGVTLIEPSPWPAERVALVAGGSAGLAGSAVLYALSTGTASRFSSSTTRVEMDRYRSSTNRLAVASGSAFGLGLGALGFGALFFIIDGDPRPTLDIRF